MNNEHTTIRDKKSKHPYHDDPSAFAQRWPRIKEVKDMKSPLETVANAKYFRMGKLKIILHEADGEMGYFMSVHGNNRYPTWDEIVWLRYNLIPDAAVMSLVLPNLNSYINNENPELKFVFTMEQKRWAVEPFPLCDLCGSRMEFVSIEKCIATFECKSCDYKVTHDLRRWNEANGNGFNGAKI